MGPFRVLPLVFLSADFKRQSFDFWCFQEDKTKKYFKQTNKTQKHEQHIHGYIKPKDTDREQLCMITVQNNPSLS